MRQIDSVTRSYWVGQKAPATGSGTKAWSRSHPGIRRAYANGEWTHFVAVYAERGKQRQAKLAGDIDSAKKATDWRDAKITDIKRGYVPTTSRTMLREVAARWLSTRTNHKDHREVGYLNAYLDGNDATGRSRDVSVQEAGPTWLVQFIRYFESGKLSHEGKPPALSSVNSLLGTMRLIFDEAMIEPNLLLYNPYHGIPKSVLKRWQRDPSKQRKHQIFATVEGANHCLAVVREHYPRSEMLVMLQATTAVRIGVALGLQWGDLDYSADRSGEDNLINFRRQWTGVTDHKGKKNYALKEGHKDGSPLIVVQIPEPLIPFIEARPEWARDTDFVFPSSKRDRPRDPDNVRRTYRLIAKRLGLERFSPHDWRHTMATWLDELGASEDEVADALQHRSTQTAKRVYVHRRGTSKRRATRAAANKARTGIGHLTLVEDAP